MTNDVDEPVHLTADQETGDRFLVYGTEKGFRLDIRYEGETLWMTQAQIAQLFGRDQSVVSRHINNVIEEGELDQASNMQKMHIANSTRPVAARADHKSENMGLQTWPNENIRKTDVAVSKNYLAEGEVRELNRLTTILLDIFEDQLDIGRLVVMQDAQTLLDRQLHQLGRTILRSGGSVKASDAKRFAETQYDKFDRQRKLERHQEADERIAALAKEAKKLPKAPRR